MKKAWGAFKKIMRRIGRFQSGIILAILYFTLFLPLQIYGTLFDLIDKKGKKGWRRIDFSPDKFWLRKQ